MNSILALNVPRMSWYLHLQFYVTVKAALHSPQQVSHHILIFVLSLKTMVDYTDNTVNAIEVH